MYVHICDLVHVRVVCTAYWYTVCTCTCITLGLSTHVHVHVRVLYIQCMGTLVAEG